MKIFKIKHSLMLLLFLFVSSFIIVSCNKDNGNDMEEHVMTNTVADDEVSARKVEIGTPDDNPRYEAYYTWIRCGSENAPPDGIAELKVYFKFKSQCECYTSDWLIENCTLGPGSARIYNRCDERSTSTVPLNIACNG